MIQRRCCLWLIGLSLLSARIGLAEETGPVYELRIYTCEPGKLAALNERFRDHTLELFEKHGIKNIAYWVPTEGPEAETTLYYILGHKSREAAAKSWEAFRADPEWKDVRSKSEETHGKILAKAPEAIYLKGTLNTSMVPLPDSTKTYELRTYLANEGKFDAMIERFRTGGEKLFEKHKIKVTGYLQPLDAPASSNTLIYIVEHDSRDAAKATWQAFLSDPDWQTLRAESEKDGPLLAKRPDAVFLKTVDYSPKAR